VATRGIKGLKLAPLKLTAFLGAMHPYALRVLATATCLGGWVGGWVSVTPRIVSKRLNLS